MAQITPSVIGRRCSLCTGMIEDAIGRYPGVVKAEVRLRTQMSRGRTGCGTVQ